MAEFEDLLLVNLGTDPKVFNLNSYYNFLLISSEAKLYRQLTNYDAKDLEPALREIWHDVYKSKE